MCANTSERIGRADTAEASTAVSTFRAQDGGRLDCSLSRLGGWGPGGGGTAASRIGAEGSVVLELSNARVSLRSRSRSADCAGPCQFGDQRPTVAITRSRRPTCGQRIARVVGAGSVDLVLADEGGEQARVPVAAPVVGLAADADRPYVGPGRARCRTPAFAYVGSNQFCQHLSI